MAQWEQQTTIKADPETVFSYVADMTKHGEWGSHQLEVRQTSSGPIQPGSTFESTAKQFGTQRETQTVTEVDAGRRFGFEAKGALGLIRHAFDVEAADGGTRLTKSVDILQPTFIAKVMSFRLKRDVRKALIEDLARIKAKLES